MYFHSFMCHIGLMFKSFIDLFHTSLHKYCTHITQDIHSLHKYVVIINSLLSSSWWMLQLKFQMDYLKLQLLGWLYIYIFLDRSIGFISICKGVIFISFNLLPFNSLSHVCMVFYSRPNCCIFPKSEGKFIVVGE